MRHAARTLTAAAVLAGSLTAAAPAVAVADPADAAPRPLDMRDVTVTYTTFNTTTPKVVVDVTFEAPHNAQLTNWEAGWFLSVVFDNDNDSVDEYEFRVYRDSNGEPRGRTYRYDQPTAGGAEPANPLCAGYFTSSHHKHHTRYELAAPCAGIANKNFRWRARTGIDETGWGDSTNSFTTTVDQLPNTGRLDAVGGTPPPAPLSAINPTMPQRLADTRETGRQLRPGEVRRIDVARELGRDPDAVAGAVLNVTAVTPAGDGYLTVFPCATATTAAPHTSNVNYTAGAVVANEVFVGAAAGGVCVTTHAATHVVVDVTGWIGANSVVETVTPMRFADTRPGAPTVDGRHRSEGRIPAGGTKPIQVGGRRGVPADATAALLNVTAVAPSGDGYLSVHPCDQTPPNASNVNYTAGSVVAGAAVATLDSQGRTCVTSHAETDVVVDVAGWVAPGPGIVALAPARLADTRAGAATIDGRHAGGGRLRAGETRAYSASGRGGVTAGAHGALVNVTAVTPDGPGHLTVFSCDQPMPLASNLNYRAGDVVANAAVVSLGSSGEICVYSHAGADVIVDVAGELTLVT